MNKTSLKKTSNRSQRSIYQRLEDVIGCKWSVSVLMAVRAGVTRPGNLERHIRGISTKVLSERLRKLSQYNLLSRTAHPEVPPRTEYTLTEAGRELVDIIERIHALDDKLRDDE